MEPEHFPWHIRIHMLRRGGAQEIAIRCLAALSPQLPHACVQDLDSVELFSGGAQKGEAVTKGFQLFRQCAYGVEIHKDRRFHDFTNPECFAFALLVTERLRPGHFCMLAPVCSNWLWLVRSTSGRSHAFPLGNEYDPTVAWSNMMVARVALLLAILSDK